MESNPAIHSLSRTFEKHSLIFPPFFNLLSIIINDTHQPLNLGINDRAPLVRTYQFRSLKLTESSVTILFSNLDFRCQHPHGYMHKQITKLLAPLNAVCVCTV